MHYVFYTDGNIDAPFLMSSKDKLSNDLKLDSGVLIKGTTFQFKNSIYEIELITPAENTSPYHLKSLLINCKVL